MPHTPGPWICYWCDGMWLGNYVIKTKHGIKKEETEHNVQLISAAPDLLEACKEAVKYWKHETNIEHEAYGRLQKAIAQAEPKP